MRENNSLLIAISIFGDLTPTYIMIAMTIDLPVPPNLNVL